MTPVPAEMLALAGERFEFTGRAGRLSGYFSVPDAPAATAAPPLLLVHSMNAAASAAEVRPLYDHARRTRPVLALDLPGFGLSERSDRAYTPRLMTDALHDGLDWLARRHGPAPVDALGVSLGCEFVARAAVEAPARFRRLALVSPTGFRGSKLRYAPAGGSVGPPWLLKCFQGPGFHTGGGWGAGLFRGLTRPGVIRYFLERTWGSKAIDEALWRYCVVTTRQSGAHFAPLHFLGAVLFSSDVNTLYEALPHPVWMSHGTRGDFTDYRGKHTVENRPNWRIRVFKDTGALMYFEQPAAFCAELDAFLD
jgi:pimeloyl-ACP methyl ester carboxylesterase